MRRCQAALWLLCGLLPSVALAAPKETVLYSFSGNLDGAQPVGPLVMDRASGVLYGTTQYGGSGYGTVFSLAPPAPGKTGWTETVLVAFDGGTGGAHPESGLVIDRSGNLYGTTLRGGVGGPIFGSGVVFEVVRPAPGTTGWQESVLYIFDGSAGGPFPNGLVLDADGNLYGTTSSGGPRNHGMVFKLAPPQGGTTLWPYTTLYGFDRNGRTYDGVDPSGTLTINPAGALVGTTEAGGKYYTGTVFSLAHPADRPKAWAETMLFEFHPWGYRGWHPDAGVIADANGTLFGTTPNTEGYFGAVFSLTPPRAGQGRWVEDLLHVFKGQDGARPHSLTAGPDGVLFGTTISGGPYKDDQGGDKHGDRGCGVVFKLTPPGAGYTRYREATVYAFRGHDGCQPRDALISDAGGNLYGVTKTGGANGGGTVFEIVP